MFLQQQTDAQNDNYVQDYSPRQLQCENRQIAFTVIHSPAAVNNNNCDISQQQNKWNK